MSTSDWVPEHDRGIFASHGCQRIDGTKSGLVSWAELVKIRRSSFGHDVFFVDPIRGWRNHVIWGGSYAQESYLFGGKSIEDLIDDQFRRFYGGAILLSPNPEYDLVIRAKEFSFSLVSDFLVWAGEATEFIAISPAGRFLFYRSESLEYSLYCRDANIEKTPFPEVSDEDLRRAYWRDAQEFVSPAIDRVRTKHLENEVLPWTIEAEQV